MYFRERKNLIKYHSLRHTEVEEEKEVSLKSKLNVQFEQGAQVR